MSHQEISFGLQMLAEPLYKPFLGLPVKIDDHISAEYDIHGFSHPEVPVHEVESSELHLLSQLRNNPYQTLFFVLSL